MNLLTLDDILAIAERVRAEIPDTIPDWLLQQPWASEPYYRFLHELAKAVKPEFVVELGTDQGVSALHLATGAPRAAVLTIDHNPAATRRAGDTAALNRIDNLYTHTGGSGDPETLVIVKSFEREIGLLYIDTVHTFAQAHGERTLYTPLIAKGGVIAHDDINVHPEMRDYWAAVPEPKIELPWLHHTSFGVSVVQ